MVTGGYTVQDMLLGGIWMIFVILCVYTRSTTISVDDQTHFVDCRTVDCTSHHDFG